MPKVLNFKAIIEQDEEGFFVASVPSLSGCHTQGKTYEEALKNIKEVIQLCLEESNENKIDWPINNNSRFLGVVDLPINIGSFA
jgi:predicted RNase H-like HicB family nuclease